MPFSVEVKGAKELQRDLKTAAQKAVPFAVRNALTTQAFEARKLWQGEIRKAYTLRNQYTERSVIAQKATGNFPGTISSKVGSFAPYMDDQEDGGIVRGRTGLKGIPGPVAAGLPAGAKRTRVVRSAARLGVLHVANARVGGSKARQNAAAIRMAIQQGNKVALLERSKGGKGLFSITGGQRRFRGKRFTQRGLKVRLLWDFSRSSVRVPAAHTMGKAIKALEPKIDHINQAAMLDQLRRYRVFGY